MKSSLLVLAAVLGLAASAVFAQQTPEPVAATYDSLADAILSVKKTEANLVRSIVEGHYRHAEGMFAAGNFEKAAAEMALFANEGDNAVAGVRKRLLEGGHHHHADGEAQGIYEPGYVVITREVKTAALAASKSLRTAGDAAAREAAWKAFDAAAMKVLGE